MKTLLVGIALAAVASKLPVEAVSIGGVRIVLQETTFAEVARHLAPVRKESAGDAGNSRTQSCYRSRGSAPITIYLESSEMGGGTTITNVDVIGPGSSSPRAERPIAKECPVVAGSLTPRTNLGIVLGMSRSEVERRLGRPGRDSAGVTNYASSEVRTIKGVRYDASSELRVRYLRGRVAAFAAGAVYSK